jgi:hypothetical protein
VRGLFGQAGATATHLNLQWTGSDAVANSFMTVTFYGPNSETTVKEVVGPVNVSAGTINSVANGLDNANWVGVCTAPGFRPVVCRWNAGS